MSPAPRSTALRRRSARQGGRTLFAAIAAAGLLLSACAGRATSADSPIANDTFGSFSGATIELESTGGIAALATAYRVQHDDRSYSYSLRHICATSCGAAIDTASGSLAPNAADSLFSIVAGASPFALEADYGRMASGADMFDYTLRIAFDGRIKTVHADDGTMPDAMRTIVDALRGTIAAARK